VSSVVKSVDTPFRLLTVAVFAAATVPRLVHRGMFVDGVTYASVARNLAEGRGSFWSPFYTSTIYPEFHEHLPLGFWLQSLWFRVFGDHLFVERAYSITAALTTAFVIAWIWRRLAACGESHHGLPNRTNDAAGQDWLPILFWITVPVVSWSIVGNLLETSVAVFTTVAVAAAIAAAYGERTTAAAGWGMLSGASIVAATLTKGPAGLFPLVAPVVFWPISGRRLGWASLAGQWATVALCAVALWSMTVARVSLTQYVYQQVLPALGGQREVSAGPLTIVTQLVQAVLAPMLVVGGLVILASRRFVAPSQQQHGEAVSLFVLGLAGTLPIAVSAKQAGHYLVPAVPLYALAAAREIAPTLAVLADRIAARRTGLDLLSAAVVLVTIGITPAVGRDRARLADLDVLDSTIPRGETVGICLASNDDWGLHAWFERRFHVSLDAAHGLGPGWFLVTKDTRDTKDHKGPEAGSISGCPPASCRPATDPARQLVLMRCR
jgi:4-amino-4-deoxy-L-arabinose transferase-like glycosyltransferase